MLAALLTFIDKVLPGERFVLAGTSLGGYLARGIAVRLRERVDGLLFRVPCVVPDTGKRHLPPAEPLLRNEALLAPLDPAERTALGEVLVQAPDYLSAMRAKVRGLRGAGDRIVRAVRARDAARSEALCLLLRSRRGGEVLRQARASCCRAPGHHGRLSRRLGNPRKLSARDLRRARPGRPCLARRIAALLAALVDDWLGRITKAEQSI